MQVWLIWVVLLGDPAQPRQVERFDIAQVRHHVGNAPLIRRWAYERRRAVHRAQQPRQVARRRRQGLHQYTTSTHEVSSLATKSTKGCRTLYTPLRTLLFFVSFVVSPPPLAPPRPPIVWGWRRSDRQRAQCLQVWERIGHMRQVHRAHELGLEVGVDRR